MILRHYDTIILIERISATSQLYLRHLAGYYVILCYYAHILYYTQNTILYYTIPYYISQVQLAARALSVAASALSQVYTTIPLYYSISSSVQVQRGRATL